jgi:hypothetical protein
MKLRGDYICFGGILLNFIQFIFIILDKNLWFDRHLRDLKAAID